MGETEKNLGIWPIGDCVLVELADDYSIIATPDKPFATKTSGVVKVINSKRRTYRGLELIDIFGRTIYFEEYKDGCKISKDGKEYAFIKIEDIRGYAK